LTLENKLAKLNMGAKSFNWKEISETNIEIDSEELLLTNTFLNSRN